VSTDPLKRFPVHRQVIIVWRYLSSYYLPLERAWRDPRASAMVSGDGSGRASGAVAVPLPQAAGASLAVGGGEGVRCWRSPADIRDLIERCELESDPCRMSRSYGSAHVRPGTLKRRVIFDQLADKFGEYCVCCAMNPSAVIDHDHISGLVRGLVCLNCNTHADFCLHLRDADCHYARYLNNPPAVSLKLRYPDRKKFSRLARLQIQVLGFNPFDESEWPTRQPAEWNWSPAILR
jgi:recombination endonuclease VII